MKRALCRWLPLLLLWPACVVLAQDDVVMKAMRDEMARSVAQLRQAGLEKPYFFAYRIADDSRTKISASLGQLTDEDVYRGRTLTVNVRVGDYALDNTNFLNLGSDFGGGGCGCHASLPLDDDYDQIRREIWLETDSQYKQAAADLAAKRSALRNRQNAPALPDFIQQPATTLSEKPVDLKLEVTTLEKLARELSAAFIESPEIVSSGVDIYAGNRFIRFLNSEGTSYTRPEPMIVMDIRAYTQAQDGQPLGDNVRIYARSSEGLGRDELLARTRDLIARLKRLRTASVIDRYNGPVLFEGEAAADVVSQVFAPAIVAARIPLSTQPQFENQFQQVMGQFGASLVDRLGGRVMPDGFDLTDDPTTGRFANQELMGSRNADDDGVLTHPIKIVEGGTLKTLLAGRVPTPQTTASTGSDRAMGASPSNLFLTVKKPKANEELRQELLRVAQQRGLAYGIVVRHVGVGNLSALMRLATTMGRPDSTGGIAVYKMFPDGHEELARADLEPVTLAAFKDILAAGDKPGVYHSAFLPFASSLMLRARGESAELVALSSVVPSLLFEDLSLKRPTAAAPNPPIAPSPIGSAAR